MKKYNVEDVQKALKIYVATHYDSVTEAAEKWGFSRSYFSQIMNGHSAMPHWVAQRLGFTIQKETFYVKVKK